MKKEMLKKLKAVILSVFMLGVVLFQFADSMPVKAADSKISDPHNIKTLAQLNSFLGLSGDECLTDKDFYFGAIIDGHFCFVAVRSISDYENLYSYVDVDYDYFHYDSSINGYESLVKMRVNLNESVANSSTRVQRLIFKDEGFITGTDSNHWGKISNGYLSSSILNTLSFSLNRTSSDVIPTYELLFTNVRLVTSFSDVSSSNPLFTGYKGLFSDNSYLEKDDQLHLARLSGSGGSGGSSGSYDESKASYKRNLGYLQGMSKKTIMLYGENASQDTNSAKYKFSYAKTSNSGFDLTQDDVYIRLYAQVAVYDKHGKGENIMVNMPKTFVGQYEASPLSLTVSAMDIFNANSDVWSQINTASWQWKTVLHGYQRMDKLYFQIVAKNPDGTWSYGGYTTLNDKVSSNGAQVTVVGTQTPDGGKDIDYAYNENISSSAGVGSTYKDAEANADANASGDGGFKLTGFNGLVEIFNSFKDGLSSFTYAFGNFPELIAKTFPFLPAFITSAISLGFLVAVVLRLLGR